MQTFLPYADFVKSVEVLDYRRLGKQRVETYQILKALKTGGGLHSGWARHPASRMWEGYELALLEYQEATCMEWVEGRRYKDTCWVKSRDLFTDEELDQYARKDYVYPPWFGDEDFHAAHQSNLVRKAPEFYGRVFEDMFDDLPYIWPGSTLEEAKKKSQK